MALTETQAYKIEVNENMSLGVRCAEIILKDGVEIARSYHRQCFAPGSDLSAEPQEVQDVAAAVWTQEVIDAYKAVTAEAAAAAEVPEVPEVNTVKVKKK
jgi:hypothetical protein|tara:strand:- start:480 stop:779 length:300 start_codon:yes stop_codon:yes gene_type:complete